VLPLCEGERAAPADAAAPGTAAPAGLVTRRAPQDPAAALTDARARLAKVWADLDEDAHRREAALPFRLPGPGHAPALTGRCAAPVCAACACARQYATHRQTA